MTDIADCRCRHGLCAASHAPPYDDSEHVADAAATLYACRCRSRRCLLMPPCATPRCYARFDLMLRCQRADMLRAMIYAFFVIFRCADAACRRCRYFAVVVAARRYAACHASDISRGDDACAPPYATRYAADFLHADTPPRCRRYAMLHYAIRRHDGDARRALLVCCA